MCILSVVPLAEGTIITSNRDEQRSRANSIAPTIVTIGERKTIIAKDFKANGTWMLTDNTGRTAILLNGAFETHVSTPPYKESRGITLINLFKESDFENAFELYNLENIEPFQLILIDKLYGLHFLWDGSKKYVLSIDLNKPHVFFSSTLYSKKQQENKRNHFLRTLNNLEECNANWLLNFHSNQNNNSADLNFFMNREKHTTKSISQVELSSSHSIYKHWQSWDNQWHEYILPHGPFN
jgi:hypothetical protein